MRKSNIKRDKSLSIEEDYKLNVEPYIEPGEIAEKLFLWDPGSPDDLNEVYGWHIIPKDFYEELERSLKEDSDEEIWGEP